MQKIIGKRPLFFLEGLFLCFSNLLYSVLTKAEEVTRASQDIFKNTLCFKYPSLPLAFFSS